MTMATMVEEVPVIEIIIMIGDQIVGKEVLQEMRTEALMDLQEVECRTTTSLEIDKIEVIDRIEEIDKIDLIDKIEEIGKIGEIVVKGENLDLDMKIEEMIDAEAVTEDSMTEVEVVSMMSDLESSEMVFALFANKKVIRPWIAQMAIETVIVVDEVVVIEEVVSEGEEVEETMTTEAHQCEMTEMKEMKEMEQVHL